MKKSYYDSLTDNRKGFLDQIYNLINGQFEAQQLLYKDLEEKHSFHPEEKEINSEIMEELDNNSDYIQRIFIDSPWGTGKTHFCNALEEKIKKNCELKVIKINAWESDYFSDPFKVLISEFYKNDIFSKEFKEKIKTSAVKIVKALAEPALECIPSGKLIKEILKAGVAELNSDDKTFFDDYAEYKNALKDFKSELEKDSQKKVILIDELDRCRPTYAIELLETIKHIFGVKNLIFVFLVNKEQMKGTVSIIYQPANSCSEYFEKFYDVYFKLPEIDYDSYLKIENEKYYKSQIYDINEINESYSSNDQNFIYEKLFFDILKFNAKKHDNKSELSVRHTIKSFQKYKILLKSLSLEEKEHYCLIIFFTVLFLIKEFQWKKEHIGKTVSSILSVVRYDNNIEKLIFSGLEKIASPSSYRNIKNGVYYEVNDSFVIDDRKNLSQLTIIIDGKKILFNNIKINMTLLTPGINLFFMTKKSLNNINVNSYIAHNSSNTEYSYNGYYQFGIIVDWFNLRYDFIKYIDDTANK